MTRTVRSGGVPGGYIVIDNGIASDEQACQIKPDWHAAVCKGDFGSFAVGGNFGFGGEPIADPVMLSRNGRRYEYTGQTTIRSGSEVRLETGKKAMSLSLREMDKGSWVIFELPGFTKSAAGAAETSLAALRAARDTAYYKDGDKLWVKLVVADAVGAGGGRPWLRWRRSCCTRHRGQPVSSPPLNEKRVPPAQMTRRGWRPV